MYKMTSIKNPETHAIGNVVVIKDDNGNNCSFGFKDEDSAFDYIQTKLENNTLYEQYINCPKDHIHEMYNKLDEFDKNTIVDAILVRYRNKCMREYYKEMWVSNDGVTV